MNLDRVIAVRNTKTVYRDGDRCIKVFDESHSKASVLSEALNQARIEETGLPYIPKITEVTTIDGKWAIVSEYIKGNTLSKLLKDFPEKKDEYFGLFVKLHTEIHRKSCQALVRQWDRLNFKICSAELDATLRYDLHNRLSTMPRHGKVCHGDFNPSNIIISDSGMPYIIDWSHATRGNAAADAALTYIWFLINRDKESAEKYLELFCEKSGTEKAYIKKWIPIVAAAASSSAKSEHREMLTDFAKNGVSL